MKELYWAGVIGSLNTLVNIVFIIALVVVAVSALYLVCDGGEYCPDSDWESDKKIARQYEAYAKSCKRAVIVALVAGLAAVFLPSKKEMLMIYGGGQVIEFVNNDSIAKQLPHDAVEALHKYLTEE